MSIEKNVQTVKDFFAALGSGDRQGLLALSAEDIEWIIPGVGWPLAGTYRGHAGLADLLAKASELETSFPKPPEFVAQGDRVLVVGFATGKVKATNKPFEDDWVFDITVRDGQVARLREYIDTQALARASEMEASPSSSCNADQTDGSRDRVRRSDPDEPGAELAWEAGLIRGQPPRQPAIMKDRQSGPPLLQNEAAGRCGRKTAAGLVDELGWRTPLCGRH